MNYHEEKIMEKTEEAIEQERAARVSREDANKLISVSSKADGNLEKQKERLDQLIKILSVLWLVPDTDVIKILLSGIVAHYFEADPLWIFLIAPPSSLKTELIASLDQVKEVFQISSLTPHTLFSGLKKEKGQKESNSVLEKIGDKIITLKDFTTVLSMRWEDRADVLGQLREVYDGKYKATYGNGMEVNWKGRIGLIAGVTPAIDTHYAIFQTLGERFIQYRLAPISEEELTAMAIEAVGAETTTRAEAQAAVSSYLSELQIPPIKEVTIPEDIKRCLGNLASFIVRARSGVVRDSYRKSLEYVPEPEAPARLVKQLVVLCCALAVLEGRRQVETNDYLLTLKVGLDCVPRQRMKVLNFLASEDKEFNTTEIAEGIDYSREGASMHVEDLVAHKLVSVKREGAGKANLWCLSERTKKYFSSFLTEEIAKNLTNSALNIDSNYAYLVDLLLKTPYAVISPSFTTGISKKIINNTDTTVGGSNSSGLPQTPDISPEERAAKDAGLFDEAKETEDTWTEMDPRI